MNCCEVAGQSDLYCFVHLTSVQKGSVQHPLGVVRHAILAQGHYEVNR